MGWVVVGQNRQHVIPPVYLYLHYNLIIIFRINELIICGVLVAVSVVYSSQRFLLV